MWRTRVFFVVLLLPVLVAQDCTTFFTTIDGHIISRGAVSTADTTPAACEQTCRSNSSCKSYQLDYNTGHALCWIQLSQNPFIQSNLYIDGNITEYVKNTTCANCFADFNATVNFATGGATLYSNITNQADCRIFCLNLQTCLSYQIDTTQGGIRCWIQFTNGELFQRTGVTEYTKFYNCPTSACTPIFTALTNGIATPGATPKPLLTTVASCIDGCSVDPQCFSYQIDTNVDRQASCWFQTDNQKLISSTFNSRPGVSEFVKNTTYCNAPTQTSTPTTTTAPTTTTTVPPCAYTFEQQPLGFASIGATPAPQFSSNETCRQGCLVNGNCVSYQLDFNPGDPFCWYQFSGNARNQIFFRQNVIEFFKACPSQTTSASTVASISSACPPIFNLASRDIASIGATARPEIVSELGCNNLCLTLSSCLSYQIDTTATRTSFCWIQTNPTNLLQDNLFSRPGVTEYIKNTTYCLLTTTSQVCPPSFNEPRASTVSVLATPRADIVNEQDCRSLCVSSSTCLSYQIDRSLGTISLCWIQTDANNLQPGNLIIRPGVIEYVKNTTYCLFTTVPTSPGTPCNLIFLQQIPGGASINAIPNATFSTNDSCRMACLTDQKCLSYQLNINVNQVLCWLQFDQGFLSGPRYSQIGVTEFIKACAQNVTSTTSVATSSSTCLVQYQANPPNQGSIGAQASNAGTFSECQAACTSDSTCVSFQINPSTPNTYCWIQRNLNALQQFYQRPNVIEYLKYCAQTSTSASSCVTTFQPFQPDQTTIQAQVQPFNTEDLCRSNCLSDPTCLGYQINTNPNVALCWFQRNAQSYNQLYFQTGVQEYRKVCLPPMTTVPCLTTYIPQTPNTATIRATPITSLTTDDQCQQACTSDSFCLSYQINNRPGEVRCWLQRSSLLDVYFQENVIEYFKSSNCSNVTTISSTSTTTTTTSPSIAITTLTTSVTTVITLSPAICSLIYQVPNPGYLSLFAFLRPTLTEATCEGNCTSDPQCKSYQLVDRACWHQLDAANLINNLYYTDMTYFEYVKICVRDCTSLINFVEVTSGFISRGAEERSQLNEGQCRDACLIDVDCKSYQIERSTGTPVCFLQRAYSPFVESNLYPKYPAITEYKKVCGTWFVATTSSSSSSSSSSTSTSTTTSSPSPSSTSASTTTATPRRTPPPRLTTPPRNITSTSSSTTRSPASTPTPLTSTSTSTTTTTRNIPINTTSSSTSTTSISPPSPITTPTTTPTTPTPSGCQTIYSWILSNNQNMAGGAFNRATTQQGCYDACIALDACIGVDIDTNFLPIACYLLTRAVPLTPAPGVMHYDLVRSPQAGCTTSTTTSRPVQQSCSSLVKSYGMNADAGIQIGSNIDEATCLSLCNSDSLCLSVDYAVQSRGCYVHRSSVGQNQANGCCIRYQKCNVAAPNQPSVCQAQFSEFPGFTADVQRSYLQTSVTLDTCRSTCLLTNCTSFSYFSVSSSCYLFRGEFASIGLQGSSTLYIKNICLDNVDLPTTTTTTAVPTPPPGYCPIDLALLLDNSGSINENTDIDNWELQKNFAQTIVLKSIRYGYNFDHVACVTFSDSANEVFNFNKIFSSTNELMTTIKSLPFAGAQTNIPSAMSAGRTLFQDSSRGSRPASIHVMILITDGVVSPPWTSNFPPEVVLLNATNIKRFAVGVGNKISLEQLTQYASPGGVALVSSFERINDALTNLTLFVNQFPCSSVIQTQISSTATQRQTQQLQTTTPTTTTSTTTSTTTTMFRLPTTSSPTSVPLNGSDCTFGVSLSNNVNGPANPLLADTIYANRLNGWMQSTDSCRMSLNASNSLVEICVGIQANTAVQLQTSGGFPTPIGFDWLSTSQNDIETGCRTAIVSFSRGVAINLVLVSGNVYSLEKQTGWSSFSVSNTIFNSDYLFSGFSMDAYSGFQIIRFPNPYVTPSSGIYNAADNTYECRNNASYFFSFSAGVPANQNAIITLDGLVRYYNAQKSSTVNGLTTISRSIFVPCNSKVRLVLQSGQIVSGGNSNLISFSAFPYVTRFGVSVSWSAFRTTDSGEADPLTFDDWVIIQGIQRSDFASVIVSLTGYYYVYVSIGTSPNQRSSVSLRNNGNVVFTIDSRSTSLTGTDIVGRGIVIFLQQNSMLKVVVERGYSIYSNTFGYHTSFFGFFLGA